MRENTAVDLTAPTVATFSNVDDPQQLADEIAALSGKVVNTILAAILDRLITETSDADTMLAARLQQIQAELRPITSTPLRDATDGLRRQALWHRLDAIVDLREVTRAASRKRTIENRKPTT